MMCWMESSREGCHPGLRAEKAQRDWERSLVLLQLPFPQLQPCDTGRMETWHASKALKEEAFLSY